MEARSRNNDSLIGTASRTPETLPLEASINPADDDDGDSERAVSLTSQQIHDLLQLQDNDRSCSDRKGSRNDFDEENQKEKPLMPLSSSPTSKGEVRAPSLSLCLDRSNKEMQQAKDIDRPGTDLLPTTKWFSDDRNILEEKSKQSDGSQASDQSQGLEKSLTSSGWTASISNLSSSSTSLMIPPPPTGDLHRLSSTPGAFPAGGSLGTTPEQLSPNEQSTPQHSSSAEPLVSAATPVLQATLVTDRDLESRRDEMKPGPLVTAEIVDDSSKTRSWFCRLCVICTCVIVLVLIISITTISVKNGNAVVTNATESFWDLDGRFREAKRQAFYVVVFGSATDCYDYEVPSLSLQCGQSNQESLILLLDDNTDDDDSSAAADFSGGEARPENGDPISVGGDGSNRRLRRFLASGGDITTADSNHSDSSSNGLSCERVSLTDLQCSFTLDDMITDEEGGSRENTKFPEPEFGGPPGINALNDTQDEFNSTFVGEMPNNDKEVSSLYPGSERRILVACAGKTDADVVLRTSLGHSVASQCTYLFHVDDQAQYFGGSTSSYLSVGQLCLQNEYWFIDPSSSACLSGTTQEMGALKYCHASAACVASQVCPAGDYSCMGFPCDMSLNEVEAMGGSAECVLPVPGNLGDVTSDLRDTVSNQVPFRDELLSLTFAPLLDMSSNSTDLLLPDPNESLLQTMSLQANHVIRWGSKTTCSRVIGTSAVIGCSSFDSIVAELDSRGADCDRLNASHISCSSHVSQEEATVLVACAADSTGGLHVSVRLEELPGATNCSEHLYDVAGSTTYGGGTANYLTMGRFCTKDYGIGWFVDAAQSNCLAGRHFGLSDRNQSLCYSTSTCSSTYSCENDGNCSGSTSCEANPDEILMTATSAGDTCTTAIGQNAGISGVMWPMVEGYFESGLSFIEGALSVSIGVLSQPPGD